MMILVDLFLLQNHRYNFLPTKAPKNMPSKDIKANIAKIAEPEVIDLLIMSRKAAKAIRLMNVEMTNISQPREIEESTATNLGVFAMSVSLLFILFST